MSQLELLPITNRNLPVLQNLMQLYLYDFSVYLDDEDGRMDQNGLYDPGFSLKRYVAGTDSWGNLARQDDQFVGFVLLSSRVRNKEIGRSVDEFFVLRKFRRQGVGRTLAFAAFDTFAGYWEIGQIEQNRPAQDFWRTIIKEYTNGHFQEEQFDEYGQMVVMQNFDSARR